MKRRDGGHEIPVLSVAPTDRMGNMLRFFRYNRPDVTAVET